MQDLQGKSGDISVLNRETPGTARRSGEGYHWLDLRGSFCRRRTISWYITDQIKGLSRPTGPIRRGREVGSI